MKFPLITSVALFFLLLFSCSSPYVDKQEVDVGSLSHQDTLTFSFELEQNEIYSADLLVKHADSYTYENLYLLITSTGPDNSVVMDTVSIQLAGEDGYWLGECRNSACSLSSVLIPRISYPVTGQFGLSIVQFSRDEKVNKIEKLGIGLKLH